MATTWTDIPATDVDIDSPVDEDLMLSLKQNDEANRLSLFGVYFVETTFTNTSYNTLSSHDVYIPNLTDYTGIQRTVYFEFEGQAGASETALFRVTGVGTTSNVVTVTSTTYVSVECTISVGSTWAGSRQTFTIQKQTNPGSNNSSARSENSVTCRVEY